MADNQTYTVQITELLRDRRFQVRSKIDPGTVNRYLAVYKSENQMPPIKVAKVNGTPVLVDGWHRVTALHQLGQDTVEAEVVEASEREAQWLAAQANLTHGLPLKPKEVREVFRAYIRARKHRVKPGEIKSYRTMAQELGGLVSHNSLRNWTQQDFPKLYRQMGGDDGKHSGGLEVTEGESFEDQARSNLQQAVAAARAVTSEKARGELVAEAERALEEIKKGGSWEPSDF